MFLKAGGSMSSKDILDTVQGVVDANRDGIEGLGEVEVEFRMVLDVPGGILVVGGHYGDDVIHVTLAGCNPYDMIDLNEEYVDWFNHEVSKTIVHEGIHRIQDQEGRFEEAVVEMGENLTQRQYLGSDIEMEAYGRADIKMDVAKYGTSVQLDEYEEIFGVNSEEVRIVKSYAGVE